MSSRSLSTPSMGRRNEDRGASYLFQVSQNKEDVFRHGSMDDETSGSRGLPRRAVRLSLFACRTLLFGVASCSDTVNHDARR